MPITPLSAHQLRLTVNPASLAFSDTSELVAEALPWIGQERAERAARFGLSIDQPGYNLFSLGEVGSGRSSLLEAAIREEAAKRGTPPDLCYLHNFEAPERPVALRLPAGQGRLLRDGMVLMVKTLREEIPARLSGPDFKADSERQGKAYKDEEAIAYGELTAFAAERRFVLHREDERMVFTRLDEEGHAMTEDSLLALSLEDKAELDHAEQELRVEIGRFLDRMRPKERAMNEAIAQLKRRQIKPLLERECSRIRTALKQQIKDTRRLAAWLDQVTANGLDQLELFAAEGEISDELANVLAAWRVNLVVDNHALTCAPVVVENNPLFRALFGSIEYQVENDVLVTDFSRIRAGSLLRAHGGFLLLHLSDLLGEPLVWEKLRRFLRSGRLQIEEPGTSYAPNAAISLEPEAVDVAVKIILVGTRDHYYELQEADPEFGRYFRIKVDFAESFKAGVETHRATAIFVAHSCQRMGLPHFTADAVARLLEEMHREAEDQLRQYAGFAYLEQLVTESATFSRKGKLVQREDVENALQGKVWRHDYPDQRLHESIAEGELLVAVQGERVGRINGLTQIDLGDHQFGMPVVVTARTFPGKEGVLNIEREVQMSGPIHDKGVFILQSYFAALFSHLGPLSVNGALSFEQEYNGVEGDSASCAEFYVLLSSLTDLPIQQGIAVTGALNQFGDVLPVGGLNEKIEGYFQVCREVGLDGKQGVILPSRNRSHLMLGKEVVEAVAAGRFHLHVIDQAGDALELLMGLPAGEPDENGDFPSQSVFGLVQKALLHYRRVCHLAEHPRSGRKTRYGSA